jgi:uncharacterized membrane protein YjjB (DUF3815 family)
MTELIWTLAQDAFWSAIAALGFAILFNVPQRLLPGCMLMGALGHMTRTLLMQYNISVEAATLLGATLVGFVGTYLAHRWRIPSVLFTITGAIPMVPGVFAYRTMIGLLNVANTDPAASSLLLAEASTNAIKTGMILVAIAFGIACPVLLFQRQKPVI